MTDRIDTAAPEQKPKKAGKPKKPLWRRIVRVFLLLLLVPVVLVGLVVGYLHTSSGKARVRALIVARVGEKMNGSIEVGELDYSIGGDLKLGGVKLRDASNAEVVSVGSLRVAPSWNDLVHGRIVVNEIALDGVRVHLVKDASGGSNLKSLFKETPEPTEKRKPLDKTIAIRKLHVGDVTVAIDQPDGTKVVVSNVGVEGSIEALPASKKFDVEITKIGATLDVDKGSNALKLAVSELTTGLSVHVVDGKGKLTLHPVSGHVALTLPGREQRKFDLGLAETTFDVGEGSLDASVGSLLTGIVALGSIQVKGNLVDGKLSGSQKADVVGLHVDAAKVNDLLGKEVLASDIDVETHVSGPTDAIALDARITTQGGNVGLKGTIGVADPTSPTYDLALSLDHVATDKLLSSALKIPSIEVGHVSLDVKGHGKEIGSMATDASLHVENVTARGVPIDDLKLDARVEGGTLTVRSLDVKAVGQAVHMSGTVEIAKKQVDLNVALEGDLGEAVARLKAAGIPLTVNLPKGLANLRPGDLSVGVKGELNGALVATVTAPHLAFAGGTIGVDARANLLRHDPPLPDGKKIEVEDIDAHITLAGLRLSSLAALRGKKLPDIDGTIGGRIDVTGTPTDPHAHLDVALRARRNDKGGPEIKVGVVGEVDATHAHLALSGLRGDADLLKGDVLLPLHLSGDPKGIDPSRPLRISLSIPKTSFADLTALLPPAMLAGKVIPQGDVALNVDLAGTSARPDGTFDVDVHANALPGTTQRVHLGGKLTPDGSKSRITTETLVWLDDKGEALATANVDATLGRSPLSPGLKSVAWHALVDVKPKDLHALPISNERVKAMGGTVAFHADFHGDLDDAHGALNLDARDIKPAGSHPVDLSLAIALEDNLTTVVSSLDLGKTSLLKIDGKAGVAGKGLIAGVRAKHVLDPTLDFSLDIPKRAIGSLRPGLALPGDLSGHIEVHGTKTQPVAKGALVVDGFTSLSGVPGKLALDLDAGKETLSVAIGLGVASDASSAPFAIEAHAPRSGIAALSVVGGKLPLAASVRAKHVDLRSLVPSFALEHMKGLGVQGELDTDLAFTANVEKTEAGPKVQEPALTGHFGLEKGQIDLPHTKRTYRDVAIAITATPEALRIDSIHASESDREVKDRSISIKGMVPWKALKPTSADVDISASKWLLFGTKNIGLADAPRGTLTIEAHASSTLDQPIKKAKVDITKLEVLFPDRFEKAHQPEDLHVGDVIFLGEAVGGAPVGLGKLPIPAGVTEKIEKDRAAREKAAVDALASKASADPNAPTTAAPVETGLDVEINVAKGARLMQSPIDLSPYGTISIESRATGRKIRGKLTMDSGELSLGGAFHKLDKGSLSFDEKNPTGFIDLYFKKPLKPAQLRDISEASAGKSVDIHMFGPIADRKTVLGGAGTAGSLYDLLAMHNEGRERFYTEPDMPIANSVEFPQQENLLVLSFLSVNLPHLIFLDRVAAWADPYDGQASYGKLEHYQGERYAADGKVRVLVTNRPVNVGQSQSELELDYLLSNTSRTLFGVGVAGGSRGGGGPDLFLEWSSKE